MFSNRFSEALSYTADIHRDQIRKASPTAHGRPPGYDQIPYIGHLIGVASIVIEAFGTEDEAIAALLHDAAEDQGGEARLVDIAERFGATVSLIVRGCSDSLVVNPNRKSPWRERKVQYIKHLGESEDRSIYLVSAADKCYNARATARDLAFEPHEEVWAKFNPDAGPAGSLWYYGALLKAYRQGPIDERRELIVSDLSQAVNEMRHWIELNDPTLFEDLPIF